METGVVQRPPGPCTYNRLPVQGTPLNTGSRTSRLVPNLGATTAVLSPQRPAGMPVFHLNGAHFAAYSAKDGEAIGAHFVGTASAPFSTHPPNPHVVSEPRFA